MYVHTFKLDVATRAGYSMHTVYVYMYMYVCVCIYIYIYIYIGGLYGKFMNGIKQSMHALFDVCKHAYIRTCDMNVRTHLWSTSDMWRERAHVSNSLLICDVNVHTSPIHFWYVTWMCAHISDSLPVLGQTSNRRKRSWRYMTRCLTSRAGRLTACLHP